MDRIKFILEYNTLSVWVMVIQKNEYSSKYELAPVYAAPTVWYLEINTVDSRYLEVHGTLRNTSRYPYLDISDLQIWGKIKSNNHISEMNM